MNQWVISDTHFGHRNIIDYCHRPFSSVGQMDETMITRWQERVKPDDIVYHIGDFGLTQGDAVTKILPRLPGHKYLILGNHDKSAERMMEFGFDLAVESMVIRAFGRLLYLCHRPQKFLPTYHGNGAPAEQIDYVLHGHIHNSTPSERAKYTNKGELVDIPSFNINMSVELWNYEPVTVTSVIKKKRTGVI